MEDGAGGQRAAGPWQIGIVGGGIAGLVLANMLHEHQAFEVTVLERDEGEGTREQGYFLGINAESVDRLRPVFHLCPGLEEVLTDCKNRCDVMEMRDTSGAVCFSVRADGVFVDRARLRSALLSNPKLDVLWNKRFEGYQELHSDPPTVRAYFTNGSTRDFDLLIGADGANSSVRRQRAPDLVYRDLGCMNVAGVAPLDTVPEATREVTKQGLCRWLGADGHTVLMFQHHGSTPESDVLLWVLSFPGSMDDWKAFAAEHEATHDEYSESTHARQDLLHSVLQRVTNARLPTHVYDAIGPTLADTRLFGPRQIYSVDALEVRRLPALSTADTRVFILGDAAHATTTHRGMGANSAITDAVELSAALTCAPSNDWTAIHMAVKEWEVAMAARGAKVVDESRGATQMIHATGFWSTGVVRPIMLKVISWIVGRTTN